MGGTPTIWNYYQLLEQLRDALIQAGLGSWAENLLAAERSASTGGEALSDTEDVLRKLTDSGELGGTQLPDQVADVRALGRQLWDGTHS
jgi:hypothetical protein